MFLAGLKTYAGIRSEFGTHRLTGAAELRPAEHAQDLVTGGMHSRMRHPIYIAHLLSLAGWAVGSGLLVAHVLMALSVCVTFPLMVVAEERELEQRFGAQFCEYKQRVPLFSLPFRKRPA